MLDRFIKTKELIFSLFKNLVKKKILNYLNKFKNVYDCEKDLKDFLHTAYFIKQMDVIFTVDTSLVHLAGTLGKKTYLFLPLVPDYRWGLKANKSGIQRLIFCVKKN